MDLAIKITAKLKANPCVQNAYGSIPAHAVSITEWDEFKTYD
jgi:hypothetical protein